jgi:hypothetical protein
MCPTGIASNEFLFLSNKNAVNFVTLPISQYLSLSPSVNNSGINVKAGSNYRSIGVDKVLFGPDSSGTNQISATGDMVRFTRTNGSGGHLKSRVYITNLILDLDNIPETDPYEPGVVWRYGDTLKISLG